MNVLLREIGYILLFAIPVAALVWTLFREKLRRDRAAIIPFEELRRRPPGESTRRKILELDERIDPWLMMLVIVPLLFAVVATVKPMSWIGVALFFLCSAVFAGFALWRLRPLLEKRRRYRLGFHGERFVAEELNQLMANGFRVFHDVPFDKWNLDHVLVGSQGVFAVETKARRKPVRNGTKEHKASYDGNSIIYPFGLETAALEQANRNAKDLATFLSRSTGEKVEVAGIVALPGWFVSKSTRSTELEVLNPGQIRGMILSRPPRLSAGSIERISFQLEQKSKAPITD